MKRMYIAIFVIILCISFGLYEMYAVDNIVKECNSGFEKVDRNIKEGDYLSAYKESIKNAKKYEEKSSSIMYCYFNHTELDSLEWNMYQMAEFIKYNQMGDYYALKSATKKQLQSIKEEELFEIQNIL